MTHEDLKKKLAEKPFGIFTITMADDSKFEVRHPEAIAVGSRTAVVVQPPEEGSDADNYAQLAIRHITKFEWQQPAMTGDG